MIHPDNVEAKAVAISWIQIQATSPGLVPPLRQGLFRVIRRYSHVTTHLRKLELEKLDKIKWRRTKTKMVGKISFFVKGTISPAIGEGHR